MPEDYCLPLRLFSRRSRIATRDLRLNGAKVRATAARRVWQLSRELKSTTRDRRERFALETLE